MEYSIDITEEHCPMTAVKVAVKLSQMESGDTLSVLLTDGEPLGNVPRSAEEAGHKVLGIEPEGSFHRVLIKKK